VFNPPDTLYSGFGKNHSQVQVFLIKARYLGPTQFSVQDLQLDCPIQHRVASHPPALSFPLISDTLELFGSKNYMLAGVYDPPSADPNWNRESRPQSLQLIFQRPYLCPSPTPLAYSYLTVPLTCTVRHSTTDIVELTPCLHELGSQGYRLAGSFNPAVSRMRQSKSLQSTIFFYFETIRDVPPAHRQKYSVTVVKGQMTVTNVSFGIKVRGQYVRTVREYSKAGWSLATILDIPDSVVAGLTTVYLIFVSPLASSVPFSPITAVPNDLKSPTSTRRVRMEGFDDDNESLRSKRAEHKLTYDDGTASAVSTNSTKSREIELPTCIREQTASRLFRKQGQPPTPAYMYGHQMLQEKDMEERELLRPKSWAFCKECCVIV